MIGQKKLLSTIDRHIEENTFPRFSIIIGPRGSEKNQIGPYIAEKIRATNINVTDMKVDNIRTIIQEAYKVITPTLYNIIDADKMSVQAQNSLLKTTEEPPNKAYFVMTLEDDNNVLPTIKSRALFYYCDIYTQQELLDYASEKYDGDTSYVAICDTPGEVDELHSMGSQEFYDYVHKVFGNISTVSGANAFKIADRIKFKDTDEGYDLILFWKAFRQISFTNGQYERARCTSMFINNLRIKALNKQMLFDKWILDIRRLKDGND